MADLFGIHWGSGVVIGECRLEPGALSLALMSSYYGGEWATYGVDLESFVGESEQTPERRPVWEDWSGSSGRRSRVMHSAERYEIGSERSGGESDSSWWHGEGWSWDSWENSSTCSRENWAYVTRRNRNHDWDTSDPWHVWHRSRDGDGHLRPSGGLQLGDSGVHEHSGESEEDGRPKGELPSGKIASVQEKADKEETKKTAGKISSSYPPVFRARQGENYRDWKRAVKFWIHGEGQQLPVKLIGPRVMVQLRDRAAQLVKHLEPEHVDGEDGLEKIFATLERSPLVKQSEKNRVDWHRKRLLGLSRSAGESLESYITRAGLYRDQLEGLDSALSMGERFYVGHLLDHCRLTRRDKAMIKTHAVTEDEVSIVGAMMELSSELEGEPGFPIGQSEAQLSGSQGEEHLVQRGVVGNRNVTDRL